MMLKPPLAVNARWSPEKQALSVGEALFSYSSEMWPAV